MTKNIAVASTSIHKTGAVERGAQEVFGDVQVQGFKAASNINEQPVGHDETLRGALNRLAHLKELTKGTRFDLYVALEGGVFSVELPDGTTEHYDCGWVVAEDADGRQAKAHCSGMQYPNDVVEEARALGFDKHTIGSVLARRGVIGDGTDTHSDLTKGLVTREDVLRQALLGALGQLK